eukprot:14266261-Alexandrium_andersonii.AAC.1
MARARLTAPRRPRRENESTLRRCTPRAAPSAGQRTRPTPDAQRQQRAAKRPDNRAAARQVSPGHHTAPPKNLHGNKAQQGQRQEEESLAGHAVDRPADGEQRRLGERSDG